MSGSKSKINRGSGNKIKCNIGSPIVIKSFLPTNANMKNASIEKFLNSSSAEEQLGLLKTIIDEEKETNEDSIVKFLAIVFYEAPAKHPVKCFLIRHVTKCVSIQESFTNYLTAHIESEINNDCSNPFEFIYYSERVPKIIMCIENFPSGAQAVERLDHKFLIQHLFVNYFKNWRYDLRRCHQTSTEKNDMFSLEHVMLRLIVHIVQKYDENQDTERNRSIQYFHTITECVQTLICDDEVPMDTKCLSGILLLLAETLMKSGSDALFETCEQLVRGIGCCTVERILSHRHGALAACCAVATTAPMELLLRPPWRETTPLVLPLLDKLTSFADGSVSEPAVSVAAGRALLQVSRSLGAGGAGAGGAVTSRLLRFVWPHLDYHLDSVRHLAQHILTNCLDYCAALEKQNEREPLESLLQSVRELGETRAFYWTVTRACDTLGAARVLRDMCPARVLLRAAAAPHLQAAASAALTALVRGGACAAQGARAVFGTWVQPALQQPAALHAVLPPAVAACPALVHYIGSHVVGRDVLECARAAAACRATLSHRALRAAAIHKDDETRILALSLVCERDRTTECATREELDTVVWFLRYNLASQRPALRTALLHYINKLFKRLDDSHRALSRRNQSGTEHYPEFIEQVRVLCYKSALRGASHGRRSAALQLLAAVETTLPAVIRVWRAEYVESLLQHLDDSYDTNKELALQVLEHCPLDLLESSSSGLTLGGALSQAACARAASGAAAAAKLRLLVSRLPHRVTGHERTTTYNGEASLFAHYCALDVLVRQLGRVAELAPWREAARGGAAGTLHCAHVLLRTTALRDAMLQFPFWANHGHSLMRACLCACERASPIVAHEAPEGHMPTYVECELEDNKEVTVTAQMVLVCAWRTIKEGAAVLSLVAPLGGRASCLEAGQYLVTLLQRALHRGALEQAAVGLDALAQRMWCEPECEGIPRRWARQLVALVRGGAAHATRRGAGLPAAIQALVSSEVKATGRAECFTECMTELLTLAAPTRAEHAPSGAPGGAPADCKGLAEDVARRTLAANVLRALFRNAALERVSQVYVPAGLRLALQGFEAAAWPERTAMSLLFCALCVRVFGVTRARGAALHARNTLPARVFFQRYPGTYDLMLSKLQGFSWRGAAGPAVLPVLLVLARLYPAAGEGGACSLQTRALVPLVQRCACASELRVRRLAASALPALLPPAQYVAYIERLLVAASNPDLFRNHWHGALLTLAYLLERIPGDSTTLESAETLESSATPKSCKSRAGSCKPPGGSSMTPDGALVSGTICALAQATGPRPCYVIAREYINVLNLLVLKFPGAVEAALVARVTHYLDDIVFGAGARGAERDLCLADCTLLYLLFLHRERQHEKIVSLILRTLIHASYEVVLATQEYLLVQHDSPTDTEPCNLRRHLHAVRNTCVLDTLRTSEHFHTYTRILGEHLHDTELYQECRLKSLQLLALENDTQMIIIKEDFPDYLNDRDDWVASKLMKIIKNCRKDVKHLYLESVLRLVQGKLAEMNTQRVIEVFLVVYECSSGENCVGARAAVLAFLERGIERILSLNWGDNYASQSFLYKALVVSTLVTLLEDDDDDIRQRTADVIVTFACPHVQDAGDGTHTHVECESRDPTVECESRDPTVECESRDPTVEDEWSVRAVSRAVREGACGGVMASAAGELVRGHVARGEGAPLLLLLALLDFRAEVCRTDTLTDECRVFDQSERYNISLEESIWTAACARLFIQRVRRTDTHTNVLQCALRTIRHADHQGAFLTLAGNNVRLFEMMANGEPVERDDTLNPKIEILVKILRGE